jgi:hypothetical protein
MQVMGSSTGLILKRVATSIILFAGHVARMGQERKVYKVLVRKPEGQRPLGRPRRRWDLREIGWGV